jgi:hypothetical protein
MSTQDQPWFSNCSSKHEKSILDCTPTKANGFGKAGHESVTARQMPDETLHLLRKNV